MNKIDNQDFIIRDNAIIENNDSLQIETTQQKLEEKQATTNAALENLNKKVKASKVRLKAPQNSPAEVQYQPLEKEKIDGSILEKAKEIANCSNLKNQEKSIKDFRKLPEGTTRIAACNHSIERNSALYHAFKDIGRIDKCESYLNTINNTFINKNNLEKKNTFENNNNNNNNNSNSHNGTLELNNNKNTKPNNNNNNNNKLELNNEELELHTVSKKSSVPRNHPKKFICAANLEMSEVKTLDCHKVKKQSLIWIQENTAGYEEIKSVKKLLKNNLISQINQLILEKQDLLSKMSFKEIQMLTILKDFKTLLEKVQRLPEISDGEMSDELQSAIDEVCSLTDGHFKGGEVPFEKDSGYTELYDKCAIGENTIYSKSSEYREKTNCLAAIDPQMKQILEKYLNEVIAFVNLNLKAEAGKTKDNVNDCKPALANQSPEKIQAYFKKHIYAHKKLSYKRFVNLFEIHSRLVNRFYSALLLLENEAEKQEAFEVFIKVLDPQNTLQETTKHRYCQGRHGETEKNSTKKHEKLNDIKPLIKLITLESPHNFVFFECAHVVPSPGLFYRRDNQNSTIGKQPLSEAYFELEDHEKENTVKSDLISIREKYKGNVQEYASHVVDLVLRLAAEESSSTIHLPSFFNQEIDGASEKYIEFDHVDLDVQNLFASYKEVNFTHNNIIYTKKLYKYVQANAIHLMVSSTMEFSSKEVLILEQEYLSATKMSVVKKINQLVIKEVSVANTISAIAFINVFMAVKNAEAKAEINLTEKDEHVYKAMQSVKKWQEK